MKFRSFAICNIFLVAFFSFSQSVDEASKILDRQQRQIEIERARTEQKKKAEELENTKFDNNIKQDEISENFDEKKFFVGEIRVIDDEQLLSKRDKINAITKYEGTMMGSVEIGKLLTELTNKLILKGFVTSSAVPSKDSDLSKGVLNIEIVPGKIGEIKINSGNKLDKYKEFFMFVRNSEKVLNMRDLDTATDNFNSINANNMKMEIVPGKDEGYSDIVVSNILKNKYTVGIFSNNYGDNKQDGIWRKGLNLNIDSPLGIGDNFNFSYMTVFHEKDPDRSWKKNVDELLPGEILPIGPVGYNPANGDVLPYKRRLDYFNFGYTAKFRDWTLHLGSSKSIQESSFYSSNTVYDLYSSNHTLSTNVEKLIFRNQKSKISAGVGIKRKHSESYLEKSPLSNRKLAMGNVSLNATTSLWKGILGTSVGYERGLKIFGAERDYGKSNTSPKAQFDKYTISVNYYKPITKKLVYRANVYGSYSNNVLYGSERQTIGGIGSVGGYQNETIQGDRAIEINNELSYSIPIGKIAVISPYAGYGYGATKYNHDDTEYATGYMTGLTTGIRFESKFFNFDFGYAKPLKHSEYLSPKSQEMYFSSTVKVSF